MKKIHFFYIYIFITFCSGCNSALELNDENKIESFEIYSRDLDYSFIGEISDQDLSVQVNIPQEMNIKLMRLIWVIS